MPAQLFDVLKQKHLRTPLGENPLNLEKHSAACIEKSPFQSSIGKRLTWKASKQNIVIPDFFCRDLCDVPSRTMPEIQFVGIASETVPLGGKNALSTKLVKRDTHSADPGEKVNEAKCRRNAPSRFGNCERI